MSEQQQALAELLKLKSFLVGRYNAYNFTVHVQDMLEHVDAAIENLEKAQTK